MAERIEAPSKAQLKKWKRLLTAKSRRQEGLFLAEGAKVVDELIKSGRPLEALLLSGEKADRWEGLPAEARPGTRIIRLSAREWETLSQDKAPEGVMAVARTAPSADPVLLLKGPGPLLLLWQVNNPGNLGALLRTADWFGFRSVLVGAGSVEATHPKVVRASMGSLFHLNLAEEVDFGRLLPDIRVRFRVMGSDPREGVPPHPCGPATALLLGSESHGLPAGLLDGVDERWRIPGGGEAESLSLPQAAAILMYECVRKT